MFDSRSLGGWAMFPPALVVPGFFDGTELPILNVPPVGWVYGICMVGVFGASGTVDMKIQESTASGGPFFDAPFGAVINSINQMAAAGGNNRLAVIQYPARFFTAGRGFCRLRGTVGTASSTVASLLFGHSSGGGSALALNGATVVEVMNSLAAFRPSDGPFSGSNLDRLLKEMLL